MKKTRTELDQRDKVENRIANPFKFVKDQVKTKCWQCEALTKEYERKMLKNLLSSDPVRQVLKPKLIDEIQGPVSTPSSASNMLESIRIMQLLHEAGFVAEMFDVRTLLECDQDQITYSCRSLNEKLIPLTGKANIED